MSTVKGGVYQRGPFWLDLERGKDGVPKSDRWYIWWYDADAGRQKRRSTSTSDVRVACDKLDEHYLAQHRPTDDDLDTYGVADAMADYWLEHAQHIASKDAKRAQLKLFNRFREIEQAAGRMPVPLMPVQVDDAMLDRFRLWGVADPIVARKKDENGNWVAGKSRKRSASTVEESVITLKAALNHAFKSRRTRYVPPIQHKTRDQITPERTYRLSIDAIGELLDYSLNGAGKYAGHGERLLPLRRYIIAGICTLARPDAIFDMSVHYDREQWMQNERRFALNPAGRIQTKKVRPVVPVVDLLHAWLQQTDDWFVCGERTRYDEKQKIDVTTQYGVRSIRSGWDTAREHLGIPAGWGPKLIRHSMATILANRGVDMIQLEMALGHRVIGKTTSRYARFNPEYLATVRDGIDDVVADLMKVAGSALHPKLTRKSENITVLRL